MEQSIYVELDALLDTRIATLALMSPEQAIHALDNGYATRLSDEMQRVAPDVSDDDYRAAYATRDLDTLAAARPTEMAYTLHEIIIDIEKQHRHITTEAVTLIVDLNTWPYVLDDDERALIAAAVAMRCGIDHYINIISLEPATLTLETIAERGWVIMVMYGFQQWWVDVMAKYTTPPKGAPGCCIVAPALLLNVADAIDPKPRTLPDGRVLDPFETVALCAAEYIGVQFLSPATFSLYHLPT